MLVGVLFIIIAALLIIHNIKYHGRKKILGINRGSASSLTG